MALSSKSFLALCAAVFVISAPAVAAPTSYSFTSNWYSGELAGTKTDGYFTFDSSSIVPGRRIETISLLTDFRMELRGFVYTGADVTSANGTFRADGSLSQITFGTWCEIQEPWQTGQPLPLGTCAASSNDRWNFFLQYDAGHPAYAGSIGDGGNFAFSSATTTIEPREVAAIPEPGSMSLLLLGVGLLATRRRPGPSN